jgi:hypothetical protein
MFIVMEAALEMVDPEARLDVESGGKGIRQSTHSSKIPTYFHLLENRDLSQSVRLPGNPQTNNRAELLVSLFC